jgi:tetratricopeptide (TPR) repeat protein
MRTLKSRVLLVSAFSLALVAGNAIYLPGVSGPFLFDDYTNIMANPYVQIRSLDAMSLYRVANSSESGPLGRPVAMLSFALNQYLVSDSSTTIFKVTNIGIHVINGLLIFWLLRLILTRLGKLQRERGARKERARIFLAGSIALLWLVHPIQLTSVLYVVQRMTSLSTLFMLLGTICYMKGRLRIVSGARGGSWIIATGVTGFGLLALFTKESALLLPVFLALLEWTLFRKEAPWPLWRRLTTHIRRILIIVLSLAVIAIFAAAVEYALPGYANRHFTLTERILTEARVLCFYLGLILVPRIDGFGIYHDDFPLSSSLLAPWTTLPAIFILTALLSLAFVVRNKHPMVSLGILWFFTGHLLESTFFALEIAHEHRNYLASLGVVLVIAYLIFHASRKPGYNGVRVMVPILALVFAGVTLLRSAQWSDFNTLAQYEVRHHPESASAHALLGTSLYELRQYEMAIQAMRRASELDGKEQVFLLNMHLISVTTGAPLTPEDEAETLRRLSSYRLSPSSSLSFEKINACLYTGCRALQGDVETWLKAAMGNLPPRGDRSFYYFVLGRALAGQGKADEALNAFDHAFQLDRNYLHPLFEIARIHVKRRDYENAERTLALLRKANQDNLHPRDREIEALAADIEKIKPGAKPERS